jgi:5-methylcytosine-specific restriction endonuclease McrA
VREPYHTPEWRRVRQQILTRDGRYCQLRLDGCRMDATHVHHIVDWRDGGAPYDPSNLVAACAQCNIAERNKRVAERARHARQPSQTRTWAEYW